MSNSFVFYYIDRFLQILLNEKCKYYMTINVMNPFLGLIHKFKRRWCLHTHLFWNFASVISRIIVCLLYRAIKWKQGRRWYNVNIIEKIFNPQATKIDHHTSLAPLILCWSKRSVIRHIKIICVVTAFPFFRSRSLKLICLLFRGKMKLSIVIVRIN